MSERTGTAGDDTGEPRPGAAADGAPRAGAEAEADGEPRPGVEAEGARSALLIDWGGVLTTDLFASFHAHCVTAGIDPQLLANRFRRDPEARELLIALEKGQLAERDFERQFARLLEVGPEGLIDGLFAGVQPDEAMVDAVRRARRAGVRTALVSNSWGVHRYPRDLFDELFDGVVISGEEGIRKPSKRMYELGAERAGARAQECVYVDDLEFNLTPARELGMATVHHTSAQTTIPQLERILGVDLADALALASAADPTY
ncbi:MAG TPA: HAD-IA family hydrolase [Solirubrobacteraceae bacterium]|nr:HAD-IA family hydrolase [Solirubrobacteraceae bacterium]